jgi:lipid-A-disaccharide synthase-like uncharacterized protein
MRSQRTLLCSGLSIGLVAACLFGGLASATARSLDPKVPETAAAAEPLRVPLQWDGYADQAELLLTPEGPRYRLTRSDGATELLDPNQFAMRSIEREHQRSALERAFNVHGIGGMAWVFFGLLGQVVFMGRMVVQWFVSERSKRSIVPPTFWFMSLIGSLMLLSYFVWRWDIVGILGQSLGTVIYVRNIMLIRHHQRVSSPEAGNNAEAAPA